VTGRLFLATSKKYLSPNPEVAAVEEGERQGCELKEEL